MAYYNRGYFYYLQQKYELALANFNQAIELNKNASFAMMGIGLVKYEQGSISEAIKQWEKALIINNQSAEIQLALAVAFYHQGEKDKALKLAESALSINSQLANIDFLKKILRTNKIFADVQKLLAHPELKNYVNQ
jgi:tetratricopeptide (TPR) repeat protein